MNNFKKAVFLDRDGVINKELPNYVKTVDELEIFSNVHQSIRKLNEIGFLIVVITNQSAVNRGLTTHHDVKRIHLIIEKYMKKNGAHIDAFYYCPHRPDENCTCRKPKAGLLLRAINDLKIDPKLSWMIGDNDSDVEAAKSIGCKAIKIYHYMELERVVNDIVLNSIQQ